MANRRSVWKKISLCAQLADVSERAALLYTWAIPHADDWGVIDGNPRVLRAMVFPLRDDLTVEDVEAARDELVNADLMTLFANDGKTFLHYPTWDEHQSGLHKRTERNRLPLPGDAGSEVTPSGNFRELPGISPPREVKGSKENRSTSQHESAPNDGAGKLSETKPANSEKAQLVQQLWEAFEFDGSPPSKQPAAFSGAIRLVDGRFKAARELIQWVTMKQPQPDEGESEGAFFLAVLKEKLVCPEGVGWRKELSDTAPSDVDADEIFDQYRAAFKGGQ